MTNAVVEVATRNPMTGTAHLFTGVIVTALMGLGLDVGNAVADAVLPPLSAQAGGAAAGASGGRPVSSWLYLPIFVPTTLAFSVLLNSSRSQLAPMTAVACGAFCCSWMLSLMPSLSPALVTFLSAKFTGALGNVYCNLTGRPAMPVTASGVFILVPGSVALRSLGGVYSDSQLVPDDGAQLTARVLATTVSIGAGVFMSSLLVVPRTVLLVKQQAVRNLYVRKGGYHRMTSLEPMNYT